MGIGLFVIYRKEILKSIKPYLLAVIFGLVILLPLFVDLVKPEISSRASGVGIFSDQGIIARIEEQRNRYEDPSSFLARALHNRPVNYTLEFLQNWSEHYSLRFLFFLGDEIQRNKVPGRGQMYMLDALWLVIGGLWIVRNWNRKTKVVVWWVIIAPTAAALTFQSPHALRAQNMVIPLTIISALGLTAMLEWVKKAVKNVNLFTIYYLLFTSVIFFGFFRYLNLYYTFMAKEYPFSSQYGAMELVNYISQNEDKYERIIVTDRYDQPYVLFLFYLRYPPEKFQANHELTPRNRFGFSTVESFDKYEFRQVDYEVDLPNNPRSLIVGTDEEIPDEANVVKEIYGTNGYKYFQIVAN
jgi:hypothetical protein